MKLAENKFFGKKSVVRGLDIFSLPFETMRAKRNTEIQKSFPLSFTPPRNKAKDLLLF